MFMKFAKKNDQRMEQALMEINNANKYANYFKNRFRLLLSKHNINYN